MRVKWSDIDAHTYENMVAVLLSRLHPTTERIDGSGGDGGRDVQFAMDDGFHVFELKSFTGRLTSSRRAQIKRSLARVKELDPVEWILVVPIDPTPSELKWFNRLRAECSFDATWRGRTWLDAEMSRHPEVHNYFVDRASDEVVRLLAELRAEQAMPESVGDAVTRLRVLYRRLNELDPYYSYDLAIGREAATTRPANAMFSATFGDARVDGYPRYLGAEQDRPITIDLTLAFSSVNDDLREQFMRSVDYGTPVSLPGQVIRQVVVDAPSGLGHSGAADSFDIGGSTTPSVEPIRFTADICDGPRFLASLPLDLQVRHVGLKGLFCQGTDATGWLRMTAAVNIEAKRFTLNIGVEQAEHTLPSAVLPLLRWLVHLRGPNSLHLRSRLWSDVSTMELSNEPFINEVTLTVIEALDEVQRRSGVTFDLPVDITPDEAHDIVAARDLLAGVQARASWSGPMQIELTLKEGADLNLGGLASPEGAALLIENSEELRLRDHVVPLGRVRTVWKSARIVDPKALAQHLQSGSREVAIEFIPGADNGVIRQRIEADT